VGEQGEGQQKAGREAAPPGGDEAVVGVVVLQDIVA